MPGQRGGGGGHMGAFCPKYTIYCIKMSRVFLTFSQIGQSKNEDPHFLHSPSCPGDLITCLGGRANFNCCASPTL